MDEQIMKPVYREALLPKFNEDKSIEILISLNSLFPIESLSEETKINFLCLACSSTERPDLVRYLLEYGLTVHMDAFTYALLDNNYQIMDLLLEYGLVIPQEDVLHLYNRSKEIEEVKLEEWYADNFPQYID